MNALTPDMDRIHPDHALIVAHGARSFLVTSLVLGMATVTIALTPSVGLPAPWCACAWIGAGVLSFLWSRTLAGGRAVVPLGAWGDSRFVVAGIGMALLVAIPDGGAGGPPPPDEFHFPPAAMHDWGVATIRPAFNIVLAPVPFSLLVFASLLCGMADGAWIAAAMRHLKLSFFQAAKAFLREAYRPGAVTSRMETGGSP